MKSEPWKVRILTSSEYKQMIEDLGSKIQFVTLFSSQNTMIDGIQDCGTRTRFFSEPTVIWLLENL